MKRNDYRCLWNGSWLAKKFSREEMKIASNKAVPKNTTTAVSWAFRVFSIVCAVQGQLKAALILYRIFGVMPVLKKDKDER